jgi:hypothetical protein
MKIKIGFLILALLAISAAANAAPEPPALAQPQAAPYSVVLTWTASTSVVSCYNVYRSTSSVFNDIAPCITPLTYTDTTVVASQTYQYYVTAVDSSGNESVPSATVVAVIPGPPAALAVSTASLPGGTVGTAYSVTLAATGGTSPYTWSATGLPAGLIQSGGVISGTPTAAGTSSVIVTVTDSEAPPVSASATLPLTVSAAATFAPIYFKAGAAYTDSQGHAWVADTKYCTGGNTYSTTHAITGALPASTDGALYQTQRYNSTTNAVCTIPVPAGTYTVTAKIDEPFFSGAGDRVYNLTINGTTELSNFDAFVAAGGEYKAIDKTFTVTTTGAAMTIAIVNVTQNAQYEAFSIAQSGPPPITVSIAPASASVQVDGTVKFTATVANDPANAGVTWSANAPGGLFTAGATPGTATVTATSVSNPAVSASAAVTITVPPPALTVSCVNEAPSRVCTFTPSNIASGTAITVTGSSDGVSATNTGNLP